MKTKPQKKLKFQSPKKGEASFLLLQRSGSLERHKLSSKAVIGAKAAGLSLIPLPWTPPYFIIPITEYRIWLEDDHIARSETLNRISNGVTLNASKWQTSWPFGILLRSSACEETLANRGQNQTIELTADFNSLAVSQALAEIYSSFSTLNEGGGIAVVVQARVPVQAKGHVSNERRVSATENQWLLEVEANKVERRFNSQRAVYPAEDAELEIKAPAENVLLKKFQEVGRWCTALGRGRVHLEWGATTSALWLFQLDFEDDLPDQGCNPAELLRNTDLRATGDPLNGSPFKPVSAETKTGWRKIDKVADFVSARQEPFPKLFWLTGNELVAALISGKDLKRDLEGIVHGRAICRTDCSSQNVPSLNLPRTESVSEQGALDFMNETVIELGLRGAKAEEICFIVHKFIPASAAAWALASPGKPVVRVDALWGLPDGLQFLPHDTFEFNVAQKAIASERIRYKPKFLQETSDGTWQVVQVARRFTRHRSLGRADLEEIANVTNEICCRLNRPIQIMWFCDVPQSLGVGRNVPWFSMPPEESQGQAQHLSPLLRREHIRSLSDLEKARLRPPGRSVLLVSPQDPDLFRSVPFLDLIADVAKERNFPVIITGSILSHAFYMLDRSGVTVVAADEPTRSRVRQRRIFNKIVRDNIPGEIEDRGERTKLAVIQKGEARPALTVKLFEEAFELLEAKGPSEVTAELADLMEVVRSLCAATGVDLADVEGFAASKRAKRGSFDRNVVLLETSWISAAKEASETPREIKLRDLASIETDEGTHNIPYSMLLSCKSGIELVLSDGQILTLAMEGNGIVVSEGARMIVSPQQLSLDLG